MSSVGLIERLPKASPDRLTLPADLQARLAARPWATTGKASSLLQTRYVVLDLVSEGPDAEQHRVNSLAAIGLQQGRLGPRDVLLIDSLPEVIRLGDYQLQYALLSLLEHIGHSPVVAWQALAAARFMEKMCATYLASAYAPSWIDLAAVLPCLFPRQCSRQPSLDDWLAYFGIDLPGRLSALPNAVGVARLLQITLAKAASRGIASVAQLRELESAFC